MSTFDFEQITTQIKALQAKIEQQEAEIAALKNQQNFTLAQTENTKTSRRKLLKGLAVALGGVAAGTLATGQAQARVDATIVGGSTAKYGVYASPTGVAANPVLPGAVECGVIAITDASAPVNFGFDTGVYGSSSNSYGITGTTNSIGFGLAGVIGFIPSSSTSQSSGVIGRTLSTTDFSHGVWGQADSGSGANSGVYGTNDSTTNNASGVYGRANGTVGTIYGVRGATASTGNNASGVYGFTTQNTGLIYGVRGSTNSNTNNAAGVYGANTATFGIVYGVHGTTTSTSDQAVGVLGTNTAATGAVFGVQGRVNSNSDGASGVYGLATGVSAFTRGVVGESASSNGAGVAGFCSSSSGNNSGVYGQAISPNGIGVYGLAVSASGLSVGVQGISNSPDGYGGYFAGGRAALRLGADSTTGIPTNFHQQGEVFVDNTGQLYFCTVSGVPGTWVKLTRGYTAGTNITLSNNLDGTTTINATAAASGVASLNSKTGAVTLAAGTNVTLDNSLPNTITINAAGGGSGGVPNVNGITAAVTIQQNGTAITPTGNNINLNVPNVVFLTKPIRVVATTNSGGTTPLLTSDGTANPNATFQTQQITGVTVDGLSVPAGAKAIIGSLTSVGATAAGNLRMWATGTATPTVNTLNIPLNPASGLGFNLTTSIFVGLNADGKVSIGYSNSVIGSTCGYSIDVAGYLI
jgi:hypothetical protein